MKHFDDLTMIDVPLKELDEDTKRRLKRCKYIEIYGYTKNWIRLKTSEACIWSAQVCRKATDKPTPMTRQQVLEKYNVLVTDDRKG